jgi:hypothetical protein
MDTLILDEKIVVVFISNLCNEIFYYEIKNGIYSVFSEKSLNLIVF